MPCETCGGNCGQCGTSEDMGIAPDMQTMINSLYGAGKPVPDEQKGRKFFHGAVTVVIVIGLFTIGLIGRLCLF